MNTIENIRSYRDKDLIDVAKAISDLNLAGKEHLIKYVFKESTNTTSLQDENTRIALIKILLATLPLSFDIIKTLLNNNSSELDFLKSIFQTFCFLDQIQNMALEDSQKKDIVALVELYLLNAEKPTAHAAWMAGDLLGDHWNLQESIPILEKCCKKCPSYYWQRSST